MDARPTHVRYLILLFLFVVTTLNYGDRATLSIAGPAIEKDLGISATQMGVLFSAFAWAYVIGQLPGGSLLDKYGTRRIYAISIFLWSIFTIFQASIIWLAPTAAMVTLFILRFCVGIAEAPAFPGNSRMSAAWFPTRERGTAAGIFTSAQYFATVIFGPIMGWIVYNIGWPYVFIFMGGLGIIITPLWLKYAYGPDQHPKINKAELHLISEGGGLVDINHKIQSPQHTEGNSLKKILSSRSMIGIFLGQYFINTVSWFFMTWFPVYLVHQGMSILKAGVVASIPAVCAFSGGVLGGICSDFLVKKTGSLTLGRKLPLVIGMLMSTSMIICNYVSGSIVIITIMSIAYFGKGFGAVGWAVVADTAPANAAGLCGGIFNASGNAAGITTPIIIGAIISATGSYNGALIYVGISALLAIFCYLIVVGKIQRMP